MKPRPFAHGTSVPVEKTRADIEHLLVRQGATQFGIVSDTDRGVAMVLFTLGGRQVRLKLPLPVLGKAEPGPARERAQRRWQQVSRQRWRAMLLLCKAKLELVDLGLSTIEREFLADIALPDGQSVGDVLRPRLEEAYQTGRMPPLLPGGSP